MTAKKAFLFCLFFMCQCICAQHDTINALEEVLVSDTQLRNFSESQSVLELNDSVIRKNNASLTSLLRYTSVISFKENGFGMVSSPSFRGTSAQQTAVVWNGINVNSQFNGLTDFNTVNTKDFNAVSIRAGGGSVVYGTGAIGGSIHLNNDIGFTPRFENALQLQFGSFNTSETNYRLEAADGKTSVGISISANGSQNDFDFPQPGRKNINGQFYNTSLSAVAGFRIDPANTFRIYSYAFDGERHFALISPTDTKTKYSDLNTRNLLEWTNKRNKLTSKIKAAFLTEEYHYFETLETESPDFGKSQTFIAKYDADYNVGNDLTLNAIVDFTNTTGKGSDVGENSRQIGSFALLVRNNVRSRFRYEAGVRKELTSNYKSPVLFSAGAGYRFTKFYTLKLNASHNFRIPTFNDLYWGEGGNPDLKPESAYQAEVGNAFNFSNGFISVTGYYMEISNMIQWLPGSTAAWFPQNVNSVRNYGIEAIAKWQKKFGMHGLELNATYAYTVSKDAETGNQLIYVPYHKATGAVAYRYRKWSADYQILLNDEVFTRSDNNPRYNLAAYTVSNLNAGYAFCKSSTVGVKAQNLFDERYEVMPGRPFPGRNYHIYLTLTF
jgi:outer membrane cobalamin receptor